MNIDQIEKALLSGAGPEQAEVLKIRGQFAKKFCAQRGWDINDLSIEQLLEIRKQPQWQNPIAAYRPL